MKLVSFVFCLPLFAQADIYNPIYRGEAGSVMTGRPNAFLIETVRGRKPGRALDVGMGQGRNSLHLASLGWDVTGIDLADEGVRRARAEAAQRGLKLNALVGDFATFKFGQSQWDLIVMTFVPTKAIAPKVVDALRPGGIVVVVDRHVDTRRVWPAGTLTDNELLSLFPGLRVLRYEDRWAPSDWSAKGLDERLVQLVAEKPTAKLLGCVWESKPVNEGATVCWGSVVFRCGAGGWNFTAGGQCGR